MRYFCTYFDSNYLVRGLALYRSLLRHAGPFQMWVLCFDDVSCHTLRTLKLDNLIPISLSEFEAGDDELLEAKKDRNTVEYYFTCSPSLLLYVLKNWREVDVLCYLDADLFFYSDPAPIYDELSDNSILIIPHRFPDNALWRAEKYGKFNVGLLAFRNDSSGRQCLDWWRERCLEWCYDRIEPGRFADQKYLDDWPERFEKVVVLEHKGANLAPWNFMNYEIEMADGIATVDGAPLIFYHFHGVKILGRRLYDTASAGDYERMPSRLKQWLYPRYIAELKRTEQWIRSLVPEVELGYSSIRTESYGFRGVVSKLLRGQVMIDYKRF
ncbi:MAG: glycosyl transferase [Acidobacteria bacterium]|nr:MAG: glycosyl transferase [Acidobacteriota bacterium]